VFSHGDQGTLEKFVGGLSPAGFLGDQIVNKSLLVLKDSHAAWLNILSLQIQQLSKFVSGK